MARRKPKIVYHLVCEDIRQEVGNKRSLIGIFQSDILYFPIPSVIPKLCYHLIISNVKSGDKIKIHLLNPDNEKLLQLEEAEFDIPKGKKFKKCIFELLFSGIKIEKEGEYTLAIVFNEDNESTQEIKLKINKSK